MAERYVNNFAGVINGGGYTAGSGVLNLNSPGTTGVTLGAGDTIHLAAYTVSGGVISVVMNWTATAVNSGTQFAVTAEGSDTNVVAGAIVIEVLSAGALNQIKADTRNGFPLTIVQQTVLGGAAGSTSWTVTFNQTAAASGNTLFMIVAADGNSTLTQPTGWTMDFNQQQNTYSRLALMHIASASQTTATITLGASATVSVLFFEVAGVHALDQYSTGGTAGIPTTGSSTSIPMPAITPAAGSAIFAFGAVTEIGPTDQTPAIGSGAWVPVGVQGNINSGRALFGYIANFAGAGVSVTPPPLMIAPLLYAGGGIAYGTFSIL